jgi:hypothetical protein
MNLYLLLLQGATEVAKTNSILMDILKAVVPGIVIALLGLITPQIRNLLIYKRTEYDFEYLRDTNDGPATWDVQWEGFRLTVKVQSISNDKIENVTFIKDEVPPGETIGLMRASNAFRPLFDKQLYVKLNSIIRFTPTKGERKYILRFVLRRKLYG